jgi:hypothetical protein
MRCDPRPSALRMSRTPICYGDVPTVHSIMRFELRTSTNRSHSRAGFDNHRHSSWVNFLFGQSSLGQSSLERFTSLQVYKSQYIRPCFAFSPTFHRLHSTDLGLGPQDGSSLSRNPSLSTSLPRSWPALAEPPVQWFLRGKLAVQTRYAVRVRLCDLGRECHLPRLYHSWSSLSGRPRVRDLVRAAIAF